MKKIFVVAAMVIGAVALSATDFIVQVEKFPDAENVKKSKMGSAYNHEMVLFAAKQATMVGKLDIPEAGKYWVYVRDYTMGGKWRNGFVFINGKKIGKFGDNPSPDGKGGVWQWNKAPFKVDLPAGEVEVKIVSNSPNTRFDAIYFTTEDNVDLATIDMNDVPELEPAN